MIAFLVLATCFLAYSNGANDNFKGVASLFGSRTCGYKTAITWATLTTFAGSITAIFLAQSLLKKFSGKGLVPDAIVGHESFAGEFFKQRLREENRGDRAGERRERRPRNRRFVTARSAAEQRRDAFEVVVR